MNGRDPLRTGLLALAVVAVLAAAWFGWSWWQASADDGLQRARDRDAVLAAAADGLVALNTVDYRDAARDVGRWAEVSTGQLGQDLADRQAQVARATASKAVATASLREAAVTELTGDGARVIAVLDVRISVDGAAAAPSRSKLTVQLDRAGDTWKLSGVQAA
ncbi:hypothetical protein [Amycolatopsis minnesotensis]|uniref:Mce-associated membrane protein n=1 Tax=Amycolatopsis minnesotensis TaxID=337894 RepID=A0ABP5CND4_9PSEU